MGRWWGEKVQIALSMTCPKVQLGELNIDSKDLNFKDIKTQAVNHRSAEFSQQERETVQELIKKLGL